MSNLQVSLRPLGEVDFVALTDLLNCGYAQLLGEAGQFDQKRTEQWVKQFSACKAISVQKNLKNYLAGFVGLRKHNQRSRSAEIVTFSLGPDPSGPLKTLGSSLILPAISKWVFTELGMNRIWIGVADYNPVLDYLEEAGWVIEGIKVGNLQGPTGRVDETICSINVTGWAGVRNGN